MAAVPESFWDNLLDYIQEGTVVPVIGSELVTVREAERDVPLDVWLARRLAADLGLPTEELPEGFGLNEVVALHLRHRGEREELYPQIHRMLRNATLTPPDPPAPVAAPEPYPGFLPDPPSPPEVIGAALAATRASRSLERPSVVAEGSSARLY